MFQIFAARMFEQRVLQAYKEKVSAERQQRLLEELAEEDDKEKQCKEKHSSCCAHRRLSECFAEHLFEFGRDRFKQRKIAVVGSRAVGTSSPCASLSSTYVKLTQIGKSSLMVQFVDGHFVAVIIASELYHILRPLGTCIVSHHLQLHQYTTTVDDGVIETPVQRCRQAYQIWNA
jgi:hypothetical protein